MTALIDAKGLAFRYGERPVFANVDFSLAKGEVVALVGPNGAGKSTLLHVLLGWRKPREGTVRIAGDLAEALSRREIARRIAFVPQEARVDFAFSVRELVSMGRTPHLGRFEPERDADLRAIDGALAATETVELAERDMSELSGGERQRVHLARALAQDTPVLLLDEPTANLDIEHQLGLLGLVRGLTRKGKAAVVALHDLSLAARFADRVVVIAAGGIAAAGPPGVVITEDLLKRCFRIRARVGRDEAGAVVVVPVGPVVSGGESC